MNSKNNKIVFVAQFPPPIHGLSKAVETLYQSELQSKFQLKKIDITSNKSILKNLLLIMFSSCDMYYFTISQTIGGNWRDLAILKLLEIKKKKVLIHLHGGYYRKLIDNDCGEFQRKLNYKIISKVAGCIVLGNSLVSIFEGMIDIEKIHVDPNCVDNEFLISSENLEIKLRNLSEQPILHILYLSNFIETKGYKEVLALAKMANEKENKNIQFQFAGKFYNSEDENYFHTYIEMNNLNNIVNYHGIVSGKSKIDLLRLCNVFILLTRYPNEGQPISILEAMGNGMAIITTNHAGIPDIVKNELNGLVVEKNDINIDQIYTQITNYTENRNQLIKIGETNYQSIIDNFTEAQYINNMDTVFQSIL